MQLENEVYEYIRQMIDEEASRLEIVESCISEFGDDYHDLEYNDWSKLVKSLLPKEEVVEEDNDDTDFKPIQVNVHVVGDKYKKVIEKLQRLTKWAQTSPIPLEKWTSIGVSKWEKQYYDCLEFCKCLELDYYEQIIDEEIYNKITNLLNKVEEYTSYLPRFEVIDNSYLFEKYPSNFARRKGIEIPKSYSYRDKYLTLLSSIPALSFTERKKLLKLEKDGDIYAHHAIIESFLPSIYAIAQQFQRVYPNIDIEDFVGEGIEAFVCNARHGLQYKDSVSYALGAAKQGMAQYAARCNGPIRLPLSTELLRQRIDRINDSFLERDTPIAVETIADILGLSVDKVTELLTSNFSYESIEVDGELDSDDILYKPDAQLIHESLVIEIDRALQTLTPREADILRKFFGIGIPEKALEEIGDELHLTRERVRQIKETAIRKLNQGQRSHILMTYLGGEYSFSTRDEELRINEKHKRHIKDKDAEESKNELEIYDSECLAELKQLLLEFDFFEKKTHHLELTEETWKEKWKRIHYLFFLINREKSSIELFTRNEIKTRISDLRIKLSKLNTISKAPEQPNIESTQGKDYESETSNQIIPEHNGSHWRTEDIELLKKMYYEGTNYEEIAKQLKRTLNSILFQLERLNVISPEKRELLTRYKDWKIVEFNEEKTVEQKYIVYFNSLKRSNQSGEFAPHKIILLLAVLALYKDQKQQKTTLIKLSDDLRSLFDQYWKSYVKSDIWSKDINISWKQMSSEPFWHECKDKSKGCYIDSDLRDLLKEKENRIALRNVLKEQLK